MNRRIVALACVVLGMSGALSRETSAQPLGAFYWQLAPFCNVVALHITQYVTPPGAVYALTGFDDQCGAGQRATLVGTAIFNHDGSIGVGLTIVTAPGGTPVHVDARVAVGSLSGPWVDSAGNAGTFAPLSPAQGDQLSARASGPTSGSRRPVLPNGIRPGSITASQLAQGAVGAGQIDPLQVQTRISENCPVGQYLRGINPNGTVACEPQPTWPRAAHALGGQVPVLSNSPQVVHSVTLTIPTAGNVLVQASGTFELTKFGLGALVGRARCWLSPEGSLEEQASVLAVLTASIAQLSDGSPFALTRGFDVSPGAFTANLVCADSLNRDDGRVEVYGLSLTALFIPAQ